MATMLLEIVTAERKVYSDNVNVVVAPGIDGELAILPNHASLLTVLKPGEIRVKKGADEEYMAVTGGFMEVMNNKVTIMADAAEHADEINLERAEEAVRRAQERIAAHESDEDLERAMAALQRSRARVSTARRRTARRRPEGAGSQPQS